MQSQKIATGKAWNHRKPFLLGLAALSLAGWGWAGNPDPPAGPEAAATRDELAAGFENPPLAARLRAYWWWLNGNVTRAAITRDLEEMKAKGFGGALICDAGGAEQDGNDRVPHGPTFLTPEWRELYRHTLREADRLGLEMSLNILSGWNLGGPLVRAEDAAQKLVFAEATVRGPGPVRQKLPEPRSRDGFYQDLFVVAHRLRTDGAKDGLFTGLSASSEQPEHPAASLAERAGDSLWVSQGTLPGDGPTAAKPAWIRFDFAAPVQANQLRLRPRPGYGPRDCAWQVAEDGQAFRTLKTFAAGATNETVLAFEAPAGRAFRLLVTGSRDPSHPQAPRNVQIAGLQLSGPGGAWPAGPPGHRPIQNWEQKALHKALSFSAPDTSPLLRDVPEEPGEAATRAADVLDLTTSLRAGGVLEWEAPEGAWRVIRFGRTIGDHSYVSTSSQGWQGYAVDALDRGAFQRYWDAVVEPLLADAGPLAGRALKYLHTDSWEVEAINWTPTLRAEFRRRRGYDFLPWLPVIAGHLVESRPVSNRFLNDFRRTIGDLAADNHYGLFLEKARRHGLLIHPESGGPHAVPIDAQQCLGLNDMPMSEFWARSWRHRVGDTNRFFVKQPAAAAHTNGRRLVAAEGFTTIGPHWQETIWDNLKPAFDQAVCEGLNLLVWHAVVCSPEEMGRPGQQYFAGTHFNPATTWWPKSEPFLRYLNRCQWLMQQGRFVADALYYYGDHVPNFAQLKSADPAQVLPGYDYDVIAESVLVRQLACRGGRLELPDGMGYRVLVLPNRQNISLPVLRKLKELAGAGATVIGPRPGQASGLTDYPACDEEVRQLARELWGEADGQPTGTHPFGQGRFIWGNTAREVLAGAGLQPDFEAAGGQPGTLIDYIHRRTDAADIYFLANRSNRAERVDCTFRVAGKTPEIWDPVTGLRQPAAAYAALAGRTRVPLELPPFGSLCVVFRTPAAAHPPTARNNRPNWMPIASLDGPWQVQFDPRWGGPAGPVEFGQLVDWTRRPEPGIQYYSGTATYRQRFHFQGAESLPSQRIFLDLGQVKELAEVRLNGRGVGIAWCPPWQLEVTGAIRDGENLLEIEVVNFWPNRLIGDGRLPVEKRITKTNIRKFYDQPPKDPQYRLMESGLLGPVQLKRRLPPDPL